MNTLHRFLRSGLAFALLVPVVVVLSGCGTSAASNLKVYVGYADTLQSVQARATPANFPKPWQGDKGVVFKGTGPQFDSGAVRIENPSDSAMTINRVVVDVGAKHYDLWGSNFSVPAHGNLILTQTSMGTKNPPEPNFDTSENTGAAGQPNGATGVNDQTRVVPVIHMTINGNTTDYRDTNLVLTTGGTDIGAQAGKPNESHVWAAIAPVNAAANGGGAPSWLWLAPLALALMSLLAFIPRILAALLLLLVGWLLAKWLGRLVMALLTRLGLASVAERTGMFGFLGKRDRRVEPDGTVVESGRHVEGWRLPWFIAQLVKWFVFLIFVQLAAEALALPQITALISRIVLWIPNLVVALLVLVLAALLAQFVGRIVQGFAGPTMGTIARYAVLAFAVLVALNQIGIAGNLVNVLFAGFVFALALAAGLAFGLGGEKTARQIWARGAAQTQRRIPRTTEEPSPARPTSSTRGNR